MDMQKHVEEQKQQKPQALNPGTNRDSEYNVINNRPELDSKPVRSISSQRIVDFQPGTGESLNKIKGA